MCAAESQPRPFHMRLLLLLAALAGLARPLVMPAVDDAWVAQHQELLKRELEHHRFG